MKKEQKKFEKLCGFCRGPIDPECCGEWKNYEQARATNNINTSMWKLIPYPQEVE